MPTEPTGSPGAVPTPQQRTAVEIDGYKDLLETLRTLHVDRKVIESAERIVREREEKKSAA